MRAQAEIIGLMLIVILAAVGFLIYVKFSLAPSDEGEARIAFQDSQMGQTFLNSMQKVTVTCENNRVFIMKTMLERIAIGQTIQGCDAEKAVHLAFEEALDGSLRKWGINYRLRFQRLPKGGDSVPLSEKLPDLQNTDIEPEFLRCGDDSNRVADRALIPVGVTQTNVVLLLERCE